MDQESLIKNKMTTVNIENGIAELKLTSPRSKIRICDKNGNHVSKPSKEKINFSNYCIEWMITNYELIEIIKQKFTKNDILNLRKKLENINISLKNSEFYSRAAQKQTINQTIGNFVIYRYKEVFYSFERNINKKLQVKITFKMGKKNCRGNILDHHFKGAA